MQVSVLRILLCIVLVLSGLGDAMASTRMQWTAHAGDAPSGPAAEVESPCHVPGNTVPVPPETPDRHGDSGGADPHPADCCSSGPACECAHAASGLPPPPGCIVASIPASPEPAPPAPVQIAPALRKPIRPPIG